MAVNEIGNARPDGFSVSLPFGPVGIGGTYYWTPGSPTAPNLTLTGGLGVGGGGLHTVFLRRGMTSQDTLGYGATANIAPTIFPSATINASIPDKYGIPLPWNARVSSIDAGVGLPGFSGTYTMTPQQVADFIGKYLSLSAMGPQDELAPIVRGLHRGVGMIGQSSQPPVGFLGSQDQNSLGGGMAGWRSSVDGIDPQRPTQPAPSPQPAPPQQPGGLLGLLEEYRRTYGDY
jgi:hypothetical protein